jgi:hypothetical protein
MYPGNPMGWGNSGWSWWMPMGLKKTSPDRTTCQGSDHQSAICATPHSRCVSENVQT